MRCAVSKGVFGLGTVFRYQDYSKKKYGNVRSEKISEESHFDYFVEYVL